MNTSRAVACLAAVIALAIGMASSSSVEAEILYPVAAAPVAAFVTLPSAPHVGEAVTLVSTSTDLVSPITGYSWALAEGGFHAGGVTMTTTFATPADQLVGLRVTAADGLTNAVFQTIHVSTAATVMYPFPVIRIVGTDFSNGTRVQLLAVKAPPRARIAVTCRGGGCRVHAARRMVSSAGRKSRWTTFHAFDGLLHPGASLTVRVSKPPLIGAYTRFSIHLGGLPSRVDSCLEPAGLRPIVCPR